MITSHTCTINSLTLHYLAAGEETGQPVLLLHGFAYSADNWRCATIAQQEIPNAQLVMFPDCGHFPHIEATQAFHGLLYGFLAK